MSIHGISTDYNPTGYETRKTEKAASDNHFAKEIAEAAQASGTAPTAILHGDNEEAGDIAVFAWADLINGSSYTVYKTQDTNSENPVYKIKTWDAAGNVTERMIDASKVDPKNCDTIEMYAYAVHLKESGKGDFRETILQAATATAVKNAEQKNAGSWDYSAKINWIETIKDIMQSVYDYGDLKGYMEWKNFLSFLEG